MKIAFTLLAMISFTVAANLLMKLGATASALPNAHFMDAFLNWRTLCGLASFGIAGLLYAVVMRWLPLNVAQSYAAAQFVAVVVASALVLGEHIHYRQWIGIVLITAGIVIVGWSQR